MHPCQLNVRSLALSILVGLLSFAAPGPSGEAAAARPRIKVMLLTGQSNRYHNWSLSSAILQRLLEQPGIFVVDKVTSPPMGTDMSGFRPDFGKYDVVVLDYEGDEWSDPTKQAFVKYVKNGGGLVSFHATDNAFPRWPEFNEMIGIGGWGLQLDGSLGARTEAAGPKVRWRDGRMVLDDSPGLAMHPPKHDFAIDVRAPDHPIMRGLPARWMHADDELYSQLRGPAKNLEVLATAFADPAKHKGASGEHEPVLMTIRYGKGRVFHTTLGHVGPKDVDPVTPLNCVGFIVTLQRGAEWAATGNVTQPVPSDFPVADKASVRNPKMD